MLARASDKFRNYMVTCVYIPPVVNAISYASLYIECG